jgi:hypothetical protein
VSAISDRCILREVAISAHASPAGSHLLIVLRGEGVPPTVIEYVVNHQQPEDAVRLGLEYARDFIDGRVH